MDSYERQYLFMSNINFGGHGQNLGDLCLRQRYRTAPPPSRLQFQ